MIATANSWGAIEAIGFWFYLIGAAVSLAYLLGPKS
jgi:hypothetical protein